MLTGQSFQALEKRAQERGLIFSSTYTSLIQTEGPSPCPLTPPLHYWPTAEAEDMAHDAGLPVPRRRRGLGGRPSRRHVAVVWWQHDAPGWKEGLFNSPPLPRMERLALASVKNITDPSLGTQDSCGLNCSI